MKLKRFLILALSLVVVLGALMIALASQVPTIVDARESSQIYAEFGTQVKTLRAGVAPKFVRPIKGATELIFDLSPDAKVLEANEQIKNAIAPLHPGRRITLKYAPPVG